MKKLIQKLITSGADLSTKKAFKVALGVMGANPQNIDKIYVEVKNSLYRDEFKQIPVEHKLVFLPQCLRNSAKCKATVTNYGYKCQHCGSCKINKIVKAAEKRGYKTFIVPGGSMVFKVINEYKPQAVLGVACMKELLMAVEELKIPSQTVELTKDGCINTDVEVSKVLDRMDGNEGDEE